MVRCRHLVRDLNDRSSPPSRLWRIFHPPFHPAAVVLPPSLPGSRLFRPELRFERLSSPALPPPPRHPLPLPSTSFLPFNLLSALLTAIENRRKNAFEQTFPRYSIEAFSYRVRLEINRSFLFRTTERSHVNFDLTFLTSIVRLGTWFRLDFG